MAVVGSIIFFRYGFQHISVIFITTIVVEMIYERKRNILKNNFCLSVLTVTIYKFVILVVKYSLQL